MIECHNQKQEGNSDQFSVGFLYGNRPYEYQGAGMYLRDALSAAQKYGDVKQADFPENLEVPKVIQQVKRNEKTLLPKAYPHRISTYFKASSIIEIKTALMNSGYVMISIPCYVGGIGPDDNKQIQKLSNEVEGYHALTIYGWNKIGWLIANSWGATGWTDDGCAVLPYNYPLAEAWGTTDEITSVRKLPFQGLLNSIYKVINKFLNWGKK